MSQHGPRNLKYVYLSDSEKLAYLPNLSQENLKILNLEYCTRLVKLPSLRFQDVLEERIEEETNARDKHENWNSTVYEIYNFEFFGIDMNSRDISLLESEWTVKPDDYILNLKGCSNLRTLSKISGNIKYMCLRSTAVKELHFSIGSLNNLVIIDLNDCKCLKNLPSSICDLESLEYLDMNGCLSIDKFPELPKKIRGLDLSGTSIKYVGSSSFECLPHLDILYMNNCKRLESLPTSICKLKSLMRLSLSDCSQLKSFPEILEPMENFEYLFLNGTEIMDLPSSIENLVMLDTLNLRQCKNLRSIPTSICKLKYLRVLSLIDCSQLESFPEILEPMEYLEDLFLKGTRIKEIPWSIRNLVELHF